MKYVFKHFNGNLVIKAIIAVAILGTLTSLWAVAGTMGGDSVICSLPGGGIWQTGNTEEEGANYETSYAAEFFEIKKHSSIPVYWLSAGDGVSLNSHVILDAILDYVSMKKPQLGQELRNIRLEFRPVDHFSKPDASTDTGFHVSPGKWFMTGCHRVYAAKQYLNDPRVELKELKFPMNEFNRAVLEFHEIVLHRNWALNPARPLVQLEGMTRANVLEFMKAGDFFQKVFSKALVAVRLDEIEIYKKASAEYLESGVTLFNGGTGYDPVVFYKILDQLQNTGLCTVHPTRGIEKKYWKNHGRDLNGHIFYSKDYAPDTTGVKDLCNPILVP